MTYFCYLIKSYNKTYIGITNNLKKRLRQHNGELTGGAKCTRGSEWYYHTVVGPFTINEALRFEWYWKHEKNTRNKWTRTKSGIDNKMKRLICLLVEREWFHINLV